MAKEVHYYSNYFTHDWSARNDRKMVRLRMKYQMRGVGIYWCLVEMLYEEGGSLPLSDIDVIAAEFKEKVQVVKDVITSFDLFKSDENDFWSNSVKRRLDKRSEKSEKAKKSAESRWRNATSSAVDMRSHSDGNAIKEKKKKGKEIKQEKMFLDGASAPEPNSDDGLFKAFQDWIVKNAPRVSKMTEPITLEQYRRLREDYPRDLVQSILQRMHNWKPLLQKNTSAYLTVRNWANDSKPEHAEKKSGELTAREKSDKKLLEQLYAK